jgi:hypothetical protein
MAVLIHIIQQTLYNAKNTGFYSEPIWGGRGLFIWQMQYVLPGRLRSNSAVFFSTLLVKRLLDFQDV